MAADEITGNESIRRNERPAWSVREARSGHFEGLRRRKGADVMHAFNAEGRRVRRAASVFRNRERRSGSRGTDADARQVGIYKRIRVGGIHADARFGDSTISIAAGADGELVGGGR